MIDPELERANIAWAQAGIRVVMMGAPIVEADALRGADGVLLLGDGWLDQAPDPMIAGADELAAALTIGQVATPDVLEVVYAGPIGPQPAPQNVSARTFGLTSIPLVHAGLPANVENDTIVFMAPGTPITFRALGHEIGHALTNRADTFFTRYLIFPRSPAEPLMPDTTVNVMRRLLHDTENQARTQRDSACLICPGNLLLTP